MIQEAETEYDVQIMAGSVLGERHSPGEFSSAALGWPGHHRTAERGSPLLEVAQAAAPAARDDSHAVILDLQDQLTVRGHCHVDLARPRVPRCVGERLTQGGQ